MACSVVKKIIVMQLEEIEDRERIGKYYGK
jgi:hypothetical protein